MTGPDTIDPDRIDPRTIDPYTIDPQGDGRRHAGYGTSDELLTGEAVALDLRPTGFVLAAAGAAIDFVVYLGAYIGVLIIFVAIASSAQTEKATWGIVSVVALVGCLIVAPAAVELLSRGKSLGRLAVGARIVRDDGGAIGFRHAAIRSVAGMLEIFGTIGGIALMVGLLSPRSKRLGDLIAGTYSQYERVAKAPSAVFGMPYELVGWAAVADVARMPVGLSRRIAQFLAQAPLLDLAAARRRRRRSRRRHPVSSHRCQPSPLRSFWPASPSCDAVVRPKGWRVRHPACSSSSLRCGAAARFSRPRLIAATASARRPSTGGRRREGPSSGSGQACTGPRPARRCNAPAQGSAR